MNTRGRALLIAGSLAMGWPASATYAQVTQSELAWQILSENVEQRNTALGQVRLIGSQNVSGEVRTAMTTALLREAKLHTQRHAAARRGAALENLRDPEFVAQLAGATVKLNDPQTIPALSAALFAGPNVSLALANFGEPAAASVVQAVAAPEGWYDTVDGGLIALRFMLEQRGEHPLSPLTMAQIGDAARQRLDGKQYFTTLWRAMDLAAALGDADLRQILERLASDPKEVSTRGVEDPELITLTQQRAADRLAGVPPLPRRADVITTQR